MINLKKLKAFAITSATGLALLTGVTTVHGATAAKITNVNFDNSTITVDVSNHSNYKYSLDGGKTWVKRPVPTNNMGTISFSTVSPKKEAIVYIEGCDSTASAATSRAAVTLAKEEKTDVTFSYIASNGSIGYVTPSSVAITRYRTSPNATWTTVAAANYDVSKLESLGGTVYCQVGLGATSSSITDNSATSITVARPSNTTTVKIPAQPKAPSVKVDHLKGLLTGLKDTIEFSIKVNSGFGTNSNKYFNSTSAAILGGSNEVWMSLPKSMNSLSLVNYATYGSLTISARSKYIPSPDTNKPSKKESRTLEFVVSQTIDAPLPATKSAVLDYVTETIYTATAKAVEYAIVPSSSSISASTKWTVLSKTETLMSSIISKLKEDSYLYLRNAGTKEVASKNVIATAGHLPSPYTKYKFAKRPELADANKATISYAHEIVSFQAIATQNLQWTTGSATMFNSANNKVTVYAGNLGVPMTSFAAINDTTNKKATSVFYRISPGTAAAVVAPAVNVGTFGSVTFKVDVPARAAAPSAKYDEVSELYTIPKVIDFTTSTATNVVNPLTFKTFTNTPTTPLTRDLAGTTLSAINTYFRVAANPAAKKIASHITTVSTAIGETKISAAFVSGSSLVLASPGSISSGSLQPVQDKTTVGNVSSYTANIAFAKSGIPVAGTAYTATITLKAADHYRFNATTLEQAKSLVTFVQTASITKATFSPKTGYDTIILTVTITGR